MKHHSNSFIFSIFVHILLFALVFLSYKQVTAGVKEKKKEPLLCVKLSSVCEPTVATPTSTLPPKEIIKPKPKPKQKKKIEPQQKKKVYTQKSVTPVKKIQKKKKVKVEKVFFEKKVVVKTAPKKVTPKKTEPIVQKRVPEQEYIDENIEKIIKLLEENLYYPRRARKRGIQGKVIVRFNLSTDAKVSNIEVLSSQSDILSRGAIQTIKNIDSKLPKPKQSITFNIPISYRLN